METTFGLLNASLKGLDDTASDVQFIIQLYGPSFQG